MADQSSLFAAFQKGWQESPHITLCDKQARKGIAVAVQDGECPVHGGDGCLFTYVQVRALRQELTGQ